MNGLAWPAIFLLAACTAVSGPPQPSPCTQVFSEARCLVMIDVAASQLSVTRAEIVAIAVIPQPTPEIRDGGVILRTLGGAPPLDVLITLRDETTRVVSMGCGGISTAPPCTDDPHLTATSIVGNGYGDLPCPGEPPAGCASPVPSPAPDALAEAVALHIDRVDISIDRVGDYAVAVGEALLPNGLLTEASFALVDRWPVGVTIVSGSVALEVRSLERDGRPFWNVYDHGWRVGTERVEAVLVFHVDRFDPGAELAIEDVVVR